jgi:hypothetical protein
MAVDVISGACAKPSPSPSPSPSPKPKKVQPKGKQVLKLKRTTCTWFLIQVSGNRLAVPARKRLGAQLLRLVKVYCDKHPPREPC